MHVVKILLVVCSLLSASDCAEIIRRRQVGPSPKASLAVVSVENFRGLHICNGILVDETVVLTAAHCVNQVDDNLRVRLDSDVVGFGGQVVAVRRNCPIAGYDFIRRTNDISVLRLETPVRFVTPAKLPRSEPTAEMETWAQGWGFNTQGVLQAVRVVRVDKAICEQVYGSDAMNESMDCLEYRGGDHSCLDGAQGSPALYKDVVVAINAALGSCVPGGPPAVFTKVPVMSIYREIDDCA